jgi:hypothetical protein
MWEIIESGGRNNVIPQNDRKDHSPGFGCWCEPYEDGNIIVHNSSDRREMFEEGQQKDTECR